MHHTLRKFHKCCSQWVMTSRKKQQQQSKMKGGRRSPWDFPREKIHPLLHITVLQAGQLLSYPTESKVGWTRPTWYPTRGTGVQGKNTTLIYMSSSSSFSILYLFYNAHKCWDKLYWEEYAPKTLSKSLASTKRASTSTPFNSLLKPSPPHLFRASAKGNMDHLPRYPSWQSQSHSQLFPVTKESPSPIVYFFEASRVRAFSIFQPPPEYVLASPLGWTTEIAKLLNLLPFGSPYSSTMLSLE